MHDEYLALRRMTERSVGKYAMERIVGAHAIAVIDVVLGVSGSNALNRLENEWANAILNQLPDDDNGGGTSFMFERTVRKMVERFFKICNGLIEAKGAAAGSGGDTDQKILDQVTFYTCLTTAQSRRAVQEMTQQLQDYIQCVRQLAGAKRPPPFGNDFYMYSVSCMYQANKLGFFLDMELSK